MHRDCLYQTCNFLHIKVAPFVFTLLIQCDLDLNKLLHDWNQHPIGRIRNTESPNGKPDVQDFAIQALIHMLCNGYNLTEHCNAVLYLFSF